MSSHANLDLSPSSVLVITPVPTQVLIRYPAHKSDFDLHDVHLVLGNLALCHGLFLEFGRRIRVSGSQGLVGGKERKKRPRSNREGGILAYAQNVHCICSNTLPISSTQDTLLCLKTSMLRWNAQVMAIRVAQNVFRVQFDRTIGSSSRWQVHHLILGKVWPAGVLLSAGTRSVMGDYLLTLAPRHSQTLATTALAAYYAVVRAGLTAAYINIHVYTVLCSCNGK